MRFTKIQSALFRSNISFVHMSSSRDRMLKAKQQFLDELNAHGTYYNMPSADCNNIYRNLNRTIAHFRYCTPTPESVNHVPVIFMDGKKSEWSDPKLYDECRFIPAEMDGIGPMVVK